jgi:Skp family chaperone for outer membrane proteins
VNDFLGGILFAVMFMICAGAASNNASNKERIGAVDARVALLEAQVQELRAECAVEAE